MIIKCLLNLVGGIIVGFLIMLIPMIALWLL